MVLLKAAAASGLAIAVGFTPAVLGEGRADAPSDAAETRELIIDNDRSQLTVPAQENPLDALAREDRGYQHSSLEPTGRFVRKGDAIAVGAPTGISGVDLVVGLGGPYADQNGGESVPLMDYVWGSSTVAFPLDGGTNQVTAPHDGLVFIANHGEDAVSLEVSGGVPVPTYQKGITSPDEFRKALDEHSESPFVTVTGDRAFGDFQRSIIEQELTNIDDELVQSWDDVMEWIDQTYGLYDDGVGVDRRSPGRLYIINPDSGGGYANAGGGRVSFHDGAGRDLLNGDLDEQWGLWHEAGHQYQSSQLRWGGLGEVTVNLASVAVESKRGLPTRVDQASAEGYGPFMALPIAERDFDSSDDVWLKLLMFDQLTRAFGDDFYAYVHHEYRERRDRGDVLPQSDLEKHDLFALTASRIADRNLVPFFEAWGIALSDEACDAIAAYPELVTEIWTDTDRETSVVERDLPGYYECVILARDGACDDAVGNPGVDNPNAPGGKPGVDNPNTPGVDNPNNPCGDPCGKPGVDNPNNPGGNPGVDNPNKPGVDNPDTPGVVSPGATGPGGSVQAPQGDTSTTSDDSTRAVTSDGGLARTGTTIAASAMIIGAVLSAGLGALLIWRRRASASASE